jgi:3-deoxy-D-manno-octulosonic-acid transferase
LPKRDLTEGPPGGWRWRLARAAYGACHGLALPLLLPLVAIHPRLRGRVGQRLGLAPAPAVARPVWLHGSSAGDVVALEPLARRLASRGLPLALSAWTRSGHQMARARMADEALIFSAPLDLGWSVGATLYRLQPRCLVLECLEIWPALVSACHRRGIPVAVVNGRLSRSSLRAYRRLRWLFEPCFRSLALVTALTGRDAERFERAGVPGQRISVWSSSKHAALLPGPPRQPSQKLVLGSVHRDEERILLPWVARLLRETPDLSVVLAPRYPHRAAAVKQRLEGLGLRAELDSAAAAGARVLVLDRMGTLAEQYADARVAFVGGSLVDRGGHNLLEPAARGVPVLVGPHTHHWRQESGRLLAEGGAAVVTDGQAFYGQARQVLLNHQVHAERSRAARQVALRMAASADGIAGQLLRLMGTGA